MSVLPDDISSVLVFLFFALSLTYPSGYVYPALIMLLAGIYVVISNRRFFETTDDINKIIATCLVFSLLWHLEVFWHDQALREHDKPFRFIAAIFVIFYFLKYPPRETAFWSGIAFAAVAAGTIALYERVIIGVPRADGFTNAIQFGNISMLFGLLCLVGIRWAMHKQQFRSLWIAVMSIGFLLGIVASFLSGSRGGWIGLPLILLFIGQQYFGVVSKRIITVVVLSVTLLLTTIYFLPATGVKGRVLDVFHDIEVYSEGVSSTSTGTRFELWRGSMIVISESPLWGMGRSGYEARIAELRKEGAIAPSIVSHSHNEILDAGARRGLIGILSLFALYFIPVLIFYRMLRRNPGSPKAVAGLVLVFSYIDFGITQVFFAHNNGVMIYSFLIVMLLTFDSDDNAMYEYNVRSLS